MKKDRKVYQGIERPKKRSDFRIRLGRWYYGMLRRFLWWKMDRLFAKAQQTEPLHYCYYSHKTILLRKLKDVDMYLQYNKITNLNLAVAKINGVVIKPGETFSIWRMVGRPTKRKGYKTGMMIHNGKVSTGIGGGLCQLGNLIYWMALHSPLTVKERWRHSFDVFPDVNRTIPFACGATLAYNYIDLQLENNTDITFKINLWLDEEYLRGTPQFRQTKNTRYMRPTNVLNNNGGAATLATTEFTDVSQPLRQAKR